MKKQIVSITALFIATLLLASCTGLFMPTGEISEDASSVVTTEIPSESSASSSEALPTSFDHDIPFEVQYYEMAGHFDDFQFPNLIVLKSVEELQANYNLYKDRYAYNSYDNAFFENSFIVLVRTREPAVPFDHTIDKISGNGTIKITVTDGVDLAISYWTFLFEIDKKYENVPFELSIKHIAKVHINAN